MKRTFLLLFLTFAMLLCVPAAMAAEEGRALALTVAAEGYRDPGFLTDGDTRTYVPSNSKGAVITLQAEEGIGGLYLMFDWAFGEYTVTDVETGVSAAAGSHGFLHEYLDLTELLGGSPKSVTLTFSGRAVHLSEIRAFTPGTPPEDVQLWAPPLEGQTDLMLMSTHGDDEQLFFAGLLPYYAGALQYNVQVVYLTDHRNLTMLRTHEMLNGLWAVGVRNYPVFGAFSDFLQKDLQTTYEVYALLGTSKEELLGFVVEQIRRFRPLVIVGHDFNGEYSHGMHMVYTDLLVQALEITNDGTAFPESAQRYGLWDVPKTYIHLYEENPIELDYDKPLDAFGGMTAFEVSRDLGFPCHVTQQGTWFKKWIHYNYVTQNTVQPGADIDPVQLGLSPITKASQLTHYSPCKFGLYRSTVGADELKNDFLEHITTYGGRLGPEETRLKEEEAARQETLRLEQERLEAEKAAQVLAQQEQLAAELARLEEQRAAEARTRQSLMVLGGILIGLIGALAALLTALRRSRKKKS